MNRPCKYIDPSRIIDLGIPIQIISLGKMCYARSLPERFHIFNYKKYNTRMPFDGCVTPYESMCYLIKTNFQNISKNLIKNGKHIINTKLNNNTALPNPYNQRT